MQCSNRSIWWVLSEPPPFPLAPSSHFSMPSPCMLLRSLASHTYSALLLTLPPFSPRLPFIHSFIHSRPLLCLAPPVNRNLSVIRIMLLCFALLGALHWLGERRRLLTHVQLGVSAFNYGKLMPGGETGLEQQQQSAPISPIAITCTALYIIAHFWSLSSHVSKPKVTHTTTCLSALVSTAPPVRLANLSHQPGSHHSPQAATVCLTLTRSWTRAIFREWECVRDTSYALPAH